MTNTKPEEPPKEDIRPPKGTRRSFTTGSWVSVVFAPLLVAAAGAGEVYLIWSGGQVSIIESALIHTGAVLTLSYFGMRSRREHGLMRSVLSSVVAFSNGQRSVDALRVSEDFGAIGQTYNRILEERDEIARQELAASIDDDDEHIEQASGELQAAIDGLWQGLALFDPTGKATVLNGAIRVQLGIDRDPALGTPFSHLFSDAAIIDALDAIVNKRNRQRSTFEVHRGENEAETILRVSVKPAMRGGALVFVEDITQQHAADEARTNMVAHTTHELRTPLSNIRLYVEEALDAPEDDHKIRSRSLNVINQETRRLERMVEDMLSASEIESGSLKLHVGDIRLDALFQELTEDYQASAADRRLTLSFDMPPKLPVIQGDRQKFSVALHNLIGNAIKYTQPGGAVSVSVREEMDMLLVEVADTGIGVSEEEAERIFERFYRANDPLVSEETGTGLGLTLAREVARLHGGDIVIESELGSGSKFTLTVPLPEKLSAAA
jgi:signal transduction histidine kinase